MSATSQDDSPIGALSEHNLPGVVEQNLADYWLALGDNPHGQVHKGDGIHWTYSGGSFFNRVVLARLDEHSVDQQIQNVVRSFQRRKAAVTWLTGPTTEPVDLGDRLRRFGFSQYEDWIGMAHRLENLEALPSIPDGTAIQTVRNHTTREEWARVVCTSFDLPPSACELLVQGLGEPKTDGDVTWHHNLAYQQGVPVAASTLFLSRGTAGIYLVSTIPEARNQGLGTSMTCLALRQARELGCNLAVLHATEAGQRIYERLGFQHCCDIGVYRLAAPRPLWKRLAGEILNRARGVRRMSQETPLGQKQGQETDNLHGIVR